MTLELWLWRSLGTRRWILAVSIQTWCYLLNSFKEIRWVIQPAPSWFLWMWIKSQFLQVKTFWSEETSSLNFLLWFAMAFLHSLWHIKGGFCTAMRECNAFIQSKLQNFTACIKCFLLLAVLFTFNKNDWIYSSLKEEEYCIKWKNIGQVKGWMSAPTQAL